MSKYLQEKVRASLLNDKLLKIKNWCKAYPLEVFPEPDFDIVKKVLEESKCGITLDAIAASNMRYILKNIQKIIDN